MRERHIRRRDGKNGKSFAAAPIDLTRQADRAYAATAIGWSQHNSKDYWKWYDNLSEIHYGVGRQARLGGYAELGIYKLGKDGRPGKVMTGGLQAEIADQLYSPWGGQRGLIERFLTLMKIPGDSYLVRVVNGGAPDGYDFVSADELKLSDTEETKRDQSVERITFPKMPTNGDTSRMKERILPVDFIGRVWRPSPRWIDMADSPMVALNADCEMLHLLTAGLKAKLMSRLASLGIVYVPAEVSKVKSGRPVADGEERLHENAVIDELLKSMIFSTRNPEDPDSAIPTFMVGPAAVADAVKHIIMDQSIAETDMKTRAEMVDRILTGLDVQPSKVTGDQGTNHWGAWAASDDEVRTAVRPDMETMCWALTRLVLWPEMLAAGRSGAEAARYVVWYDLSDATSHVNVAEDARQLADRGLIGDEATRRATGFPERDAATEPEKIRAIGIKIGDPYLATYGLTEQKNFDWDKIGGGKTGPPADSPADPSSVQPGKGNPGAPGNSKSKTPARLRPA